MGFNPGEAMSHMVFQSVVAPKPLSPLKPCLPIPRPLVTLPCKLRRGFVRASSSFLVDDSVSGLERCLQLPSGVELGPSSSGSFSASTQMCPVMKGKFGSVGAVTLEKGKLDMTQKISETSPEVSLSYSFLFFLVKRLFGELQEFILLW